VIYLQHEESRRCEAVQPGRSGTVHLRELLNIRGGEPVPPRRWKVGRYRKVHGRLEGVNIE